MTTVPITAFKAYTYPPIPSSKATDSKAGTINCDEFSKDLAEMPDAPDEEALREALKAATTVSDVHEDALTPDLHLLNLWAKIGGHECSPIPNKVEVPQIYVPSTLLFNIIRVGLCQRLQEAPHLKFMVYADDISLWTKKGGLDRQQNIPQAGLDVVQRHLEHIGLRTSEENAKYVVVVPKKEHQVAAAAIIAPVWGYDGGVEPVKEGQLKHIQFALHTVLDNGEVWPTQMVFFTDPIPAQRERRTRISPR
ncbi:hypothetical protein IscW_ISCW012108 [Ixodes scapularis]|uniref:Reverse transcriptase domain-containing protein n=1 Tax=Ixodes scapularis TaxID=6945 RepID=B7QEB3_IXOSC|nr:hypothetical protein IscW_ISCW012108 [Ixodes scapularis]|eukprot:XP_002413877.1 hypothetical protein IscW_ISCW012108 [Ixodes scapularis]